MNNALNSTASLMLVLYSLLLKSNRRMPLYYDDIVHFYLRNDKVDNI